MAQWCRSHPVLAEYLSSVPSVLIGRSNLPANSISRDPVRPHWAVHSQLTPAPGVQCVLVGQFTGS